MSLLCMHSKDIGKAQATAVPRESPLAREDCPRGPNRLSVWPGSLSLQSCQVLRASGNHQRQAYKNESSGYRIPQQLQTQCIIQSLPELRAAEGVTIINENKKWEACDYVAFKMPFSVNFQTSCEDAVMWTTK